LDIDLNQSTVRRRPGGFLCGLTAVSLGKPARRSSCSISEKPR